MSSNHALGAPLSSRLGSEAQAHMLQLALIERSLRRALWPFSQSLPIWGHKTQYVAWCGKPTGETHNERIKKIVESSRNDVTLETGVHYHHVCIKPTHGLDQARCREKVPDYGVPFSRVISSRWC